MRAIVLLLAAALCCGSANALVPHQINYQGYLTAVGGAPVNATVKMVLTLYDAATSGNVVYTETHDPVTVTNGVFNVLIGSPTPIPGAVLFDVPYWLGIAVETDAEMTPRQPVAASGYAIRSATTEALAPGAAVLASQITGTIGTTQLANGAVTAAKLASNSCTAGQILKYNGSAWACGADTNSGGTVTSITAGTGLTGGTITATGTIGLGTVPLANLANCSAEGDVAVMHSGAWVCRSSLGYVDNGNGTVTDNNTGLMWEQTIASNDALCTNATQSLRSVRCTQNLYTWSTSTPAADGTLFTNFLATLNQNSSGDGKNACFANHCDWRIPTISELQTILLAPDPCGGTSPCIDQTKFGPTQAYVYWSSSSLESVPNSAWGVSFFGGGVGTGPKNSTFHARAVRSGR